MQKVVISLCDLTGVMVQPWIDSGDYHAILVDPQHPDGITHDGAITKIGHIIDHPMVWGAIGEAIRNQDVAMVCGFPPCTDLAVSGARHFENKRERDPHFQAKAALVAEQCKVIGSISGAPWFFENPVSVLSSIMRKPDHIFNPYEYGGYLPEDDRHPLWPEYIAPRDAYPKRTCLWTGGGFRMPEKRPVAVPDGYSTQHKKLGGKSQKTKNIRSATPRGFARAVYLEHGDQPSK